MVNGMAGSIIMDVSSLFFLCGILNYTSLYRKRGRLDDKLFLTMIVVNMIYAAVELMPSTPPSPPKHAVTNSSVFSGTRHLP